MQISDLGEFPLIDRINEIVSTERSDVVVGIGDDVAVLVSDADGDDLILATVDSQVEDIHFLRDLITPKQLGRRALAINLSDIAAMGGRPQYALVSLALPSDTEVTWVKALYRGLREEGDRFETAIVGGNMASSSGQAFIDVCVLGRVSRRHLLLRSGAQVHDKVLVTGHLGDAAAGLAVALDPHLPVTASERDALLSRYLVPEPRLPESAIIARSDLATAMIDVSDGLSSDIGHICDRSQVGVRLWAERLPISLAARHVAELTDKPVWQFPLGASDDYELCFTVPPDAAEDLMVHIQRKTAAPVTIIGEILPAEKGRQLILEGGERISLEAKGWQHFAPET
ncbi:MAG: thiamine-phosphate kinase [Anaerolineales bacterium]